MGRAHPQHQQRDGDGAGQYRQQQQQPQAQFQQHQQHQQPYRGFGGYDRPEHSTKYLGRGNKIVPLDRVINNKKQFAVDDEDANPTVPQQQQQQPAFAPRGAGGQYSSHRGNTGPADDYGRGAPTDRLVYGYSPAIVAEAVAFHSQYAAADWRRARKQHFREQCLKPRASRQHGGDDACDAAGDADSTPTHFETDLAVLQLRLYWLSRAKEERRMATTLAVATGGGGDDAQFGKLLADMFGGDDGADGEGAGAGSRRQRDD